MKKGKKRKKSAYTVGIGVKKSAFARILAHKPLDMFGKNFTHFIHNSIPS